MADSTHAATDLTRRQLFVGTAATAVALWAGCRDDEGGGDDAAAGTTTTRPPPELDGDPFALGVASGDPRSDSVILWTRLAPDPLAPDGLGGMPDTDIDVTWEVATDEAFEEIVARGVAVAEPGNAHAVHAEASGLDPGTGLHYRFRLGDRLSPTGRTRTLPTGSPDRFGLAIVNCQWFELGQYGAYRHLVEEGAEIDLVVHLGDYIYEYPGAGSGVRATLPTRQLDSLVDYRLRYTSYRMDEHLRAAHARYPFVLTWDDHEVSNNYSGGGLRERPVTPPPWRAARRRPTEPGGRTSQSVSRHPPAPRWRCTSTWTSETSPASTSSTSGSTATSPRAATATRRPTTSGTARSAPTSARSSERRRRPGSRR